MLPVPPCWFSKERKCRSHRCIPSTSFCQPAPGWGLRTAGIFKRMDGGKAETGKTSQARSNHLKMVSSVPFGVVTCSLAVTLGKCRSPTVLCLPLLFRDLRDHQIQICSLPISHAYFHVFNENQYQAKQRDPSISPDG